MKVLGVIPARGGSKGVPRKNIKPLFDKPLIAYTIETCRKAKLLSRFIVSTDDPHIAEIARQYNADVPFLRPQNLASDDARAVPVIQHALKAIEEKESEHFDVIVMLQPTTPFRNAEDIDGALTLLQDSCADSVISVADVGGHHPARMKYIENNRLIDPPFCELEENQPRQELVPVYIRNGAIYATKRETLLQNSFKGNDCRPWIMPPERSVNIDTQADFLYAEWLLSEKLNRRTKML